MQVRAAENYSRDFHRGEFRRQDSSPSNQGSDDHQALFPVSNIKKAVEQGDRLFFVFGKLDTKRIDTERRRCRYRNGISCWHMEFLANRRNWRSGHAFGKTLVVDVRDIKNAEPAFSLRGVRIFSASL